ncbi:hypothetical protein HZB60_06775 [candidate division KSB1 bacterium]|nr:hypothetical protein [candidate division KSB1 bacterium]
MPHLTEADLVRSLALGSIAVALCLKPLLCGWDHRSRFVFIAAGLAVWFAFDLAAVYDKSRDIVRSQTRNDRFRRELLRAIPSPAEDKLVIAVMDPGYKGDSVYRRPLLQDIKDGEVPYGVMCAYSGQKALVSYLLVRTEAEAIARGAACLVLDRGAVRTFGSASSERP